jgi:hypothetical protein
LRSRGKHGKKPHGKSSSRSKLHAHKTQAKEKTEPTTQKPAKAESKKRPHKEPTKFRHPSKKKTKRSQKITTLEDRLEYYKKKYGDNFKVKKTTESPRKLSLIKKITRFFKKGVAPPAI